MSRNNNPRFNGMGIGYVSLVMLFTVICLTVLAVLSYQAAGANDMLNEKNGGFTAQYYAADSAAKETLAELDGVALLSQDGFFADEFAPRCDELRIEGLTLQSRPDGCTVGYSVPINAQLSLKVQLMFYAVPIDGARYSIQQWKTTPTGEGGEIDPPDLWDGTLF